MKKESIFAQKNDQQICSSLYIRNLELNTQNDFVENGENSNGSLGIIDEIYVEDSKHNSIVDVEGKSRLEKDSVYEENQKVKDIFKNIEQNNDALIQQI